MAASATPHGAVPVGSLVSCAYNAKVTHYKIKSAYGTSIFFGDFVKFGDDNPNTTIQKDTGTSTATPVGIFLGCAYTDPTLNNLRLVNIFQLLRLRVILLRMLLPIRL